MFGMCREDLYEDKHPLTLTDEENLELAEFDRIVQEASSKKVLKLREFVRGKGLTAEKLEDLTSANGEPFTEEEQGSYEYYTRAIAAKIRTLKVGRGEFPVGGNDYAYLCIPMYLRDREQIGCGWVKGKPIARKYDNIGPMSGSSRYEFHCKICGDLIGREVRSRS